MRHAFRGTFSTITDLGMGPPPLKLPKADTKKISGLDAAGTGARRIFNER
jgi:hypothetical protein